jgi:hypothetical protein
MLSGFLLNKKATLQTHQKVYVHSENALGAEYGLQAKNIQGRRSW